MQIESLYIDNEYLEQNPNWHREDAPWKANLVATILKDHQIQPNSICEVGCGSGDILRSLRENFLLTSLVGYDISPQVTQFWEDDKDIKTGGEIAFKLGNFHKLNTLQYDVLIMLDVFEHVRDSFTFLEETHAHAKKFVFHIPLDLSASGVARKSPLLNARRSVGHLHYYTKDLALETLTDCGYKIIDWRYTGASLNLPVRSLKTRLASYPRKLFYWINKDVGVRLLGGETLLVLAE
jgi:cyclopropane fatty-acyl-phospholipid synthase-like methyltransferase